VLLGDIWGVLPLGVSTCSSIVTSLFLPGLTSAVEEALSLSECGFVVTRNAMTSYTVDLTRIFGTFAFENQESWKPFGDLLAMTPPTVGLRIENISSGTPIRAFVRIEEKLEIDGVTVPIIFETKRNLGALGTVYKLSYISRPTKALPLSKLISWLSLGNLDLSGVPGLGKLLDDTKISTFSLGWYGSSGSPKTQKSLTARPDFVDIAIEMNDLPIVPNLLTMQEAWVEMHVAIPKSGSKLKLSVGMTTTLTIGECDVDFWVAYGDRPEWRTVDDEIPGHFKLALTSTTRPLSLRNILNHFLPEQKVLPSAVETILTRTGITKFQMGVEKDELENNHISLMLVEIGLEVHDVNIFGKYTEPNGTTSTDMKLQMASASLTRPSAFGLSTRTMWYV
jgi:hypothetical protein